MPAAKPAGAGILLAQRTPGAAATPTPFESGSNATAEHVAQARLQVPNANLERAKAKPYLAERDWERARRLGPFQALAQASYDGCQSAYETAQANVAVSEASIPRARTAGVQAEAANARAQHNVDYMTIRSPVKGAIIGRRVKTGQTAVASPSAPSLFLLAQDLIRMQVWVARNEADIGKTQPGQPVSFTIVAFSGDTFRGEVGKIRLNASMTRSARTLSTNLVALYKALGGGWTPPAAPRPGPAAVDPRTNSATFHLDYAGVAESDRDVTLSPRQSVT